MAELLSPTNDYVFKRIFSDSPELLVWLINDVRPFATPVLRLSILNPEIPPNEISGKTIRLDVLAKDDRGGQYNIEIQVYRYRHWYQRGLYYLSRMMETQLQAGATYQALQANVGVHLLDFDLFTATDAERLQASWCFEMRDAVQPEVSMGDVLQLNLIELNKAYQLASEAGALRDWISFFKRWREDWKMTNIQHKPVLEAMEKVRALSQDERERAQAWARDKALRDDMSMREQERSEGKAEGITETERNNLLKLAQAKFGPLPEAVQAKIAEANAIELGQWFDQALVAQQLEDIWR
jgi:predicted transposase/invertase (TIGR01784 family)